MRAPKQVLVIPYLIDNFILKLFILKRSDLDVWQWVAGGVESDESTYDAAIRESTEELGIVCEGYKVIELETKCSIPKCHFKIQESAYEQFYTVTEYSYAIQIKEDDKIELSDEHYEYACITYEQLANIKTWDSNKTAAWELHQRLLDLNVIVS